MSYLNKTGLATLWNRIKEVFAQKTQAVGSGSLSGTSLYLTAVSGGSLSTIDLSSFATDTEAVGSVTFSGTTLTISSVSGGNLGTINLDTTLAKDSEVAKSLFLSGTVLSLKKDDGTFVTGSSVDLGSIAPDTSGLGASIAYSEPYLYLYNSAGTQIDYAVISMPYVPNYSLSLNGKSLSLLRDGLAVSTVTLP